MIRLTPIEAGFLTTETANLCEGAEGRITIPVACWIVEHPKGTVIFDTGLHNELVDDTTLLGVLAGVFDVSMKQDLGAQIREAGFDPAAIDYIVFSHLHFDHSGGTAAIPNGRVVVQRDEWQYVHSMGEQEAATYTASDYDLGHDIQEVEGLHDIFGDGAVVCVPTPGHTAGHQSLRVRLESGDVLLVGDCCYWQRMLEEDLVPPYGFDHAQQRQSMMRLRELQADGIKLMFGHDPDQWQQVVGTSLT